jgi:hypothetical protein
MLVTLSSGVLLYSNRDGGSWNNTRNWTFKKKAKDTFTVAAQQLTARTYVSAMNGGTKVCSWKEKDPNLGAMVVVNLPDAAAFQIHCTERFTRIFVVVQADSGVLLLSNELKIVSNCKTDEPKAKVIWTEMVRDVLLVLRVVSAGKKESQYELIVFHVEEGRKSASKVTKMGSHTLKRPAEAGKEKASSAGVRAPRLTFHAKKSMLSVVWGGEWWQLFRFDSRLQWYRSMPEHVSTRALGPTPGGKAAAGAKGFFASALSDSYLLTCQAGEIADEEGDEDTSSLLRVWDISHGLFVPGVGESSVKYEQPAGLVEDQDGAPIAVSINASADASGRANGLCEVAVVLEHAVLLSWVHAAPATLFRALEMGRSGKGQSGSSTSAGNKRGRSGSLGGAGAVDTAVESFGVGSPPAIAIVPARSLTAALRLYTNGGESGGATSRGGGLSSSADVCVHVEVDQRKWEAEVMARAEGAEARVLRRLLSSPKQGGRAKAGSADALDDQEFVRTFEEYVEGDEGEGHDDGGVLLSQRFVSAVSAACLERAASAAAKSSATDEAMLLPLQPLHSLLQSEQVSVQQVPQLLSSLIALGQQKQGGKKGGKKASTKGSKVKDDDSEGTTDIPSLLVSCLHLVADLQENAFVDVLRFLFQQAEGGTLEEMVPEAVGEDEEAELGRGKRRRGSGVTEDGNEDDKSEGAAGRQEGDVRAVQMMPLKTSEPASKKQKTSKTTKKAKENTADTATATATATALEQYLCCVVSAPKTASFLRAALTKLYAQEVQLLLVYLKRWLYEYKHRLPSKTKYRRAGDHSSKHPSLAQVCATVLLLLCCCSCWCPSSPSSLFPPSSLSHPSPSSQLPPPTRS